MTKKDDQASISLIADFDGDVRSLFNIKVDENIPILPLRNMVLFPGIIIPVAIERSFSKEVVNISNSEDKYIGVVCQKNSGVDTPLQKDMYSIGTVAKVVRILEAIDNKMVVLLQGFNRFKLKNVSLKSGVYYGEVEVLEEGVSADNNEILAISEACKESMYRILKLSDPGNDAAIAVKNIANHTVLINFIAANINIPVKEKIDLLRVNTEKARAYKLLKILNREFQFEALKARIQDKTREELDQQQQKRL